MLFFKENALLDTLYKIRSVTSRKNLQELLFDDLRLEEEAIMQLDWNVIQSLVPLYHSTTLNTLLRWRDAK
ncbi:hypothetical protein SAMN06298221_11470 [Sphaerochaeta associata]|jgi:hypothetical protein|uniref:Uncharacterized protein n=1 Tax=Sphaerochaeta associata TaxID=1129264 RepID=A0ABY4DAR2_9SPIR|nr:hypothetical protein [Sphaerochaeta associata]MDD4450828.1 hypothetical protein [Sphaerochaeta sp.]MEA5027395.1 hypothetical protein [Sphaerochaeta associata]UOM51364.1 hypothetical protein MUG09_01080 [Sphaerochaeta associata]SMP62565.1 hypothetical protein SAMN06298221_11470 [Sphaerochaeta associata]